MTLAVQSAALLVPLLTVTLLSQHRILLHHLRRRDLPSWEQQPEAVIVDDDSLTPLPKHI